MAHAIDDGLCTACAACLDECAAGAVKLDGAREIYFIEAIACTDCGDCVAVCPVEAIAPVD